MIQPVAKSSPVNRVAKHLKAPAAKPKAYDAEADRIERSRINARCDSMFDVVDIKWGVELHGYLGVENVPAWLEGLAHDAWVMLPESQGTLAMKFARQFVRMRPDAISDAASLALYNRFVADTLQSGERFCRKNVAAHALLTRACNMLGDKATNGLVLSPEWEEIADAAESLREAAPEGSPVRCMMNAISNASSRFQMSALWTWESVEAAFGRTERESSAGGIRRQTRSILPMIERIVAMVKEGHSLTKPIRKRAAA